MRFFLLLFKKCYLNVKSRDVLSSSLAATGSVPRDLNIQKKCKTCNIISYFKKRVYLMRRKGYKLTSDQISVVTLLTGEKNFRDCIFSNDNDKV